MTVLKFLKVPFVLALLAVGLVNCGDDDEGSAPNGATLTASFQSEVDATNFLQVSFTNFSTDNAVSFAWDFGDDTGTSTDENPVYTYAEADTYTVTLTATDADGNTDDFSADITLTDPDQALTLLAGIESKTWKLLRDNTVPCLGVGATIANPFEFFALVNDGSRNCLFEHEFTFTRAGAYIFEDNDGFWGEFGVYDSEDPLFETCFEPTAENLVNKDGADISAWASGTHAFAYNVADGKITLTGQGAWIAVPKLGTTGETTVPVSEVTFDVRLAEGGTSMVDTMIVNFIYTDLAWEGRYVHYQDAGLEPPLDATPTSSFSIEQSETDNKTFTFTNTSNDNAVTFAWDFGDESTSTEENPTHTYAEDGSYTVTLTTANASGEEAVSSQQVTTLECDEDVANVIDPQTGINLTWEGDLPYFGAFGGIAVTGIDNPFPEGDNTSCRALRITKSGGCEGFAGMAADFNTSDVIETWNFSSDPGLFTLDVYGVDQAATVKLRFEKAPFPDTEPSIERTATMTGTGAWESLTFDFTDDDSGDSYTSFIIYFEQGETCDGDIYYMDNLVQQNP